MPWVGEEQQTQGGLKGRESSASVRLYLVRGSRDLSGRMEIGPAY